MRRRCSDALTVAQARPGASQKRKVLARRVRAPAPPGREAPAVGGTSRGRPHGGRRNSARHASARADHLGAATVSALAPASNKARGRQLGPRRAEPRAGGAGRLAQLCPGLAAWMAPRNSARRGRRPAAPPWSALTTPAHAGNSARPAQPRHHPDPRRRGVGNSAHSAQLRRSRRAPPRRGGQLCPLRHRGAGPPEAPGNAGHTARRGRRPGRGQSWAEFVGTNSTFVHLERQGMGRMGTLGPFFFLNHPPHTPLVNTLFSLLSLKKKRTLPTLPNPLGENVNRRGNSARSVPKLCPNAGNSARNCARQRCVAATVPAGRRVAVFCGFHPGALCFGSPATGRRAHRSAKRKHGSGSWPPARLADTTPHRTNCTDSSPTNRIEYLLRRAVLRSDCRC